MTANQRRPGFRLPWSSETDAPGVDGEPSATAATTGAETPADAPTARKTEADPVSRAEPDAPAGEEQGAQVAAATPESASKSVETAAPQPAATEPPAGDEFMQDLVAAMRRVADEARRTGVSELRARADEQVKSLESDAERRREELRARAEADVAGVGEWAKAEAERIKAEAEQRVVARRAQLEQQLAGDAARTESETKAVRDRVAEYERELEAYHAQLAEINDPAAFAAAAKRMPRPPKLGGTADVGSATATATATGSTDAPAPVEPVTRASNGVPTASAEVHPAEEEVLAARLAELDASLPAEAAQSAPPAAEPTTTEVVVKGLGSFGAITGFRQSLSGVDGIDGVALSLGQTGEFVFRATHAVGFDVRTAIAALEGDGAKIEDRPEGGLRVTLDRAR